ncbi:Wzz/FepE/Etk N-terminal domain-containing protein [Devosia sp. XJ19-1]|uniref:Wzz/FepE/Etk N-terminal domain-containing protein n=1 Tax=Devosia ureilytica TaxID=2952754 RepID=A0A9Q4APL3_9HYPH|nr:Wzz/FepE/Etk N-terminal domain-containing protein [Devosia ureilytica]MCP8884411.1 Wzz/FepE/Etk N-terminal domain-containing protein [Devosia ureilytica]MCP8888019.1 Wzz/FepE/Etk N-terminal domain-containing protein [Devosia ureilytica]
MLEKSSYPEALAPQPSDIKTIDLERIVSLLRRQALVLVLCVAFMIMLAVIYLTLAPRSYLSAGQILIDRNLEQVTGEGPASTSATDLEAQVLNQVEVLRSSRVARSVAEAENLTTDQEFLNPPPSFTQRIKGFVGLGQGPQSGMLEATQDEVVGMLRSNVQVDRMGRSSIIRVGYEAPTPELAQRIASAYANALLQDQLNAELEATSAAADWLEQRLAEIGESQRQASLAIQQYRDETGLSVGEDRNLTTRRIEALSDQLAEAQAEMARLRALSEQLQAVVAAGPQAASNFVALLGDATTDPAEIATLRNQVATLTSRIAEIEAGFGADHPQLVTLRAEKSALDSRIFALLQNLDEQYRTQLSIARQQEAGLRADIAAEGQNAGAISQEQVRLNELQQRSAALQALYTSYLARYEEAVQRQSFPIPSVRIVTDALLPEAPSSPRTMVILAAALIAGSFAGVVLGMLNELRERGFRTGAQIRQQLGLRFLGYVPALNLDGDAPSDRLRKDIRTLVRGALGARIGRRWGAPLMETLKSTRLVLQPMADRGTAILSILSVLPDEGKSTFARSLAEMLAAIGSRVLLIDADIGADRSGLPARIMPSQQGDWRRVAETDLESGLVTLSAAAPEAGGGDLSSIAMQKVLAEARGQFDYVLIDLPALGPVIDALTVLPHTDASVLVVDWGRTPRRLLRGMLEREPELADHIVGVVLNKVDLGKLPRFTDAGGLERFAYRGDMRSSPEMEPAQR